MWGRLEWIEVACIRSGRGVVRNCCIESRLDEGRIWREIISKNVNATREVVVMNVTANWRNVRGEEVIAKENQQDDSSGATNLPLL